MLKFNSTKQNIFFTSDTHYNHRGIVRGVSRWDNLNKCRNFDTVEKMNSVIVSGINKHVKENDILIHLGDWSMGGIESIWAFRNKLNVRNIHLVYGNHDKYIMSDRVLPNIVWGPNETYINCTSSNIFTSINNYLEIKVGDIEIILFHYPISSWNNMYKGSWMLHGHTHGALYTSKEMDHYYKTMKTMDIGIDVAYDIYGEYKPFNFKEIQTIINKRKFISINYHDKKNNG